MKLELLQKSDGNSRSDRGLAQLRVTPLSNVHEGSVWQLLAQTRFALFPLLLAFGLCTLAMGGPWVWAGGALLLVAQVVFDEPGGNYLDRVAKPNALFLETVLYAAPALIALATLAMLLHAADAGTPMAALARRLGIGADGAAWWIEAAGAVFSAGIFAGCGGVAFAHELSHRRSRRDWLLAQALLARCMHPSIALEHIFGHHVNVGTPLDPSTPPRGMGFWRYLPRAVAGEVKGAWTIEKTRLSRRGRPVVSAENRFLQGLWLQAALLAGAFALAGFSGLAALVLSGVYGLLVIELGNYVTHYGLVRAPGQPVRPRHSWNAPRFGSTSTLINSSRHSHHHASTATPYWNLAILEGAPIHRHGIALMAFIALVPPLWFKAIKPQIEDWDARMASPEELALARSGQAPSAMPVS